MWVSEWQCHVSSYWATPTRRTAEKNHNEPPFGHQFFFIFPPDLPHQTQKCQFDNLFFSILHNIFRPPGPGHLLTCTEYFAKDCLVTGQEQACRRISWLFVCLFAVWNKSHGWWQLLFLYSSTICGQRNLTFGFIVVSLTMLLLFVFCPFDPPEHFLFELIFFQNCY